MVFSLHKKGQINIEFTGGAVLFFVTLIFVITTAFSIIPKYAEFTNEKKIENVGWTVTEVLLNDDGYWANATTNGTDWENHPDHIQVLGLANTYHQLDPVKVNAVSNLDYGLTKYLLDIDYDFSIRVKEYAIIDTIKTYQKGHIENIEVTGEPETPFFLGASTDIHYGSKQMNGTKFYFIVAHQSSDYRIYISSSSDFSTYSIHNSSDNETKVNFNLLEYYLDPTDPVKKSEGNLIILSKDITSFGIFPEIVDEKIYQFRRFANIDNNLAEVDVTLW